MNTKKRKLEDLIISSEETEKKLKISKEKLSKEKVNNIRINWQYPLLSIILFAFQSEKPESEKRTKLLKHIEELQSKEKELQTKLQEYQETDPEVFDRIKEKTKVRRLQRIFESNFEY